MASLKLDGSGHLTRAASGHLAKCPPVCSIEADYHSFPADSYYSGTTCGYATVIEAEGREDMEHITYYECDGESPCSLVTPAFELFICQIHFFRSQVRSGVTHSCDLVYDVYEVLKYTGSPVGVTDGWPYLEAREVSRSVAGTGGIIIGDCVTTLSCSVGNAYSPLATSCSSTSIALSGIFGSGGTLDWTRLS